MIIRGTTPYFTFIVPLAPEQTTDALTFSATTTPSEDIVVNLLILKGHKI